MGPMDPEGPLGDTASTLSSGTPASVLSFRHQLTRVSKAPSRKGKPNTGGSRHKQTPLDATNTEVHTQSLLARTLGPSSHGGRPRSPWTPSCHLGNKMQPSDFSGGPVAKSPSSQCLGPGFNP